MKICKRCKTEKPLDDFYIERRNKDGHAGYCKICNREKTKMWKRKHYSRINAAAKLYRADNSIKMPFSQYLKELKANGRY